MAVSTDLDALEWQRLDRIKVKCSHRISAKLTAAETLAVALSAMYDYKFEYRNQPLAWREKYPDIDWSDAGVNLAAKLALRQYREATGDL